MLDEKVERDCSFAVSEELSHKAVGGSSEDAFSRYFPLREEKLPSWLEKRVINS
jgi:hypothetical protein